MHSMSRPQILEVAPKSKRRSLPCRCNLFGSMRHAGSMKQTKTEVQQSKVTAKNHGLCFSNIRLVCGLQLKLRRADKPQVRDKDMGEWLCYHPTGGAITVLCNGKTLTGMEGRTHEQPLNF